MMHLEIALIKSCVSLNLILVRESGSTSSIKQGTQVENRDYIQIH